MQTNKRTLLRIHAARQKIPPAAACVVMLAKPFKGNQIRIGADFAKKTQDKRKALLPFKKHLQEKDGQDSKVFISYPETLNYVNGDGTLKIMKDGDFKRTRSKMEDKEMERRRLHKSLSTHLAELTVLFLAGAKRLLLGGNLVICVVFGDLYLA